MVGSIGDDVSWRNSRFFASDVNFDKKMKNGTLGGQTLNEEAFLEDFTKDYLKQFNKTHSGLESLGLKAALLTGQFKVDLSNQEQRQLAIQTIKGEIVDNLRKVRRDFDATEVTDKLVDLLRYGKTSESRENEKAQVKKYRQKLTENVNNKVLGKKTKPLVAPKLSSERPLAKGSEKDFDTFKLDLRSELLDLKKETELGSYSSDQKTYRITDRPPTGKPPEFVYDDGIDG